MTDSRTPDSVIDAWLRDGPRQLPAATRYSITSALADVHQRRHGGMPLPFVLGGATAAIVVAAIILVVSNAPRPDVGPPADAGRVEIHLGDAGADLSRTDYDRGTVFVSDGGADEYGCVGSAERAAETRGITVADVTHAAVAGVVPEGPELGVAAESFIEALRRFGATAIGQGFVGDQVVPKADVILPAQFESAARLDVTDASGTTSCALDLSLPSRVWAINVAGDVASHTIAVQAWATTDEGLVVWLPNAIEIVRDMNLTVIDEGASDAMRSGALVLTNSEIRFAYELPSDLGLDVQPTASPEGPNGVMGFADPEGRRGVVIANVTLSSIHGETIEPVASVDELVQVLGSSANLVVTEPVAATLDGREALAFDITHIGVSQLPHVDVSVDGGAAMALEFTRPSRLILLDLDFGGPMVAVQIWAQSEDELDSWVPDAMRLVDTIHFIGVRDP